MGVGEPVGWDGVVSLEDRQLTSHDHLQSVYDHSIQRHRTQYQQKQREKTTILHRIRIDSDYYC